MASSSSSPCMLGELARVKTDLEEEAKEVIFGGNYKFKSSSHSEGEETTLFKFLEENSKYYGGGKLFMSPSLLFVTLIRLQASPPQDRIEDQKGDRNMTTDIKTAGDGQNRQQHLLEKRTDRQNCMSDFEPSTERTSTAAVLESQHTNSDFGASFSEIEPGSVSTVLSADSALGTSCRSEHLPGKRTDRQNGISDFETSTERTSTTDVLESQHTNSDFGASFSEIEPGSVSTVLSADSALGTSSHSEHLPEKRTDRQNGMSDFETSTERTSTTDVLESQQTNSDFGASFSKIEPGSVSTMLSADSALDTTCRSEHLLEKRTDRRNGMSAFETSTERTSTIGVLESQHTNSDFGASFSEIEPGSVSTVLSADSALGTSRRSEHLLEKRRDRQNSMSDFETSTEPTSTADVLETQQTNSDFGASFSKIEPGSVSTMLSAYSALDTTRRSEPPFTVSLVDHDPHKEKSSRPPILDYFTTLNEHKYGPINLFEAVDWFKCIANVHPVDQRSELDKEVGMFCRDWLTHHRDPSIQYLDTSFDADMEKVYESDVYMQVRDRVKTFDEDTVVALKRFMDMTPMTEQVFKYEMNWALVDKHKLHEKLRPWISIIVNNSAYEGGNTIVSNILESLKSHGSASSILKNVFYFKKVINEADSEMLFLKMWKMIFFEINKLVQVDGNNPLGVETFDDTTKLKEWALSVEINWAVFDQHELHEKMSPWIRKEVIKLLKKEKASVVDEVIDAIRKQNSASQMLELLAPSLEDDTEFVVKTLWRTLLILVNILETDPVWNSEESSDCVVGVIKRNRGYDYTSILRQMKMLDFEMLCEANRLKGIIPRNIGKLSFYKIDWAVSDKEELHNRLRPWIFRWIMDFVRPEKVAISVVDSIVAKIKEHANVKAIFELVKPSLGERSSIFVLVLWTKLIWQIQLAGMTAGHPVIDGERSTVEISEYGDRYSRNRHFMFDAFDYENLVKLKQISEAMPKTKEDLFSCEIKWDVYEKHGLQKTMWEGICAETLELTRQKQDAAGLAFDQIMWSIFDYHVSASRREFDAQKEAVMVVEEIMSRLNKYHVSPYEMMEFLEPIFGSSGSEKLVMKMWYALVCSIKIAEAGVEKKLPPGWGSAVLLPDKTRR